MKCYRLNGFRFYIDNNRARIEVADDRDKVLCSIEEARNVYKAVKAGTLGHSLDAVRALLNHENLFAEYDSARDGDTVCTIAVRKDATAYIKKYTWNQWMCDTMLGRDHGAMKRCSDGELRWYEYV